MPTAAFLLFLIVIVPAAFGAFVATVTLLPPLRALGTRSAAARSRVRGVLGIIAAMALVGSLAGLLAASLISESLDVAPCCLNAPTHEEVKAHKALLTVELTARTVTKPFAAETCFIHYAAVCDTADKFKIALLPDFSWLVFLGIPACVALAASRFITGRILPSGGVPDAF